LESDEKKENLGEERLAGNKKVFSTEVNRGYFRLTGNEAQRGGRGKFAPKFSLPK